MQAVPLTGRDARVATLRAKLSVARLRAQHGATKKIRDEQRDAAAQYAATLRYMSEDPS